MYRSNGIRFNVNNRTLSPSRRRRFRFISPLASLFIAGSDPRYLFEPPMIPGYFQLGQYLDGWNTNEPRKYQLISSPITPTNKIDDSCAVCLEKMENDLVFTPCSHTFHHDCLSEAIKHNPKCPLCRTNFSTNGFVRQIE